MNKKYSISSFSKQTKDLINRTIVNNIELDRHIKKGREKLVQNMTKNSNISEDYGDMVGEIANKIIKDCKLAYDWSSFIWDWIDTGKRPKIIFDKENKFKTEIKIELYPADENNQYWVPALPQFSYVTITAPLSAKPEEISDLFNKAQKKLFSPIKVNKTIRTIKDSKDKERFTAKEKIEIIKLYIKGDKAKKIAKQIHKIDKPTKYQIDRINEHIGNNKKQSRKFLNKK